MSQSTPTTLAQRRAVMAVAQERLLIAAGGFALLFGSVLARLLDASITPEVGETLQTVAYAAGFQWAMVVGHVFVIYGLYRLRWSRLALYGLVEVIVGVVTAVLVANQIFGTSIPGLLLLFVAEIGAIYVGVRGLDNIYKSLSGSSQTRWEAHFNRKTSRKFPFIED